MIEYLYDAIRSTSGEEVTIVADITDDKGAEITKNCYLKIYQDEDFEETVSGTYSGGLWYFVIPKEITDDLTGRYFYNIFYTDGSISFKQPIYFV